MTTDTTTPGIKVDAQTRDRLKAARPQEGQSESLVGSPCVPEDPRSPMKARAAVAIAMLASVSAFAQTTSSGPGYPARPLRLIVPFPAGGGSDAVARIISPKLTERLGQQIVVDNRAGAGGSVGTEAAVKSTPDGYTMVLASTSEIAINPALYRLTYDTLKDLTPVAMIASTAMVIVVSPSAALESVKDLVALAKQKPGAMNVASAGNGTITHLSGELFRALAGVNWTHVPYKGAPAALTDVAGGRVQLMFSSLPAAVPLIRSGRVKAIAVSTRNRQPSMPDAPTVIESGVPEYDVEYWYGIFVPAATPEAVVKRLAGEIEAALKQKDTIANLANQGALPGNSKGAQFARFVQGEHARWTKLAKSSGAKAD
jgi:tripartite-type tricarboxylate transporter receptor subunit TctC